ncbi:MAG TPA: hypothetical protein VGS58_20190, partial [Candidatus Sulfopaludibacter sp.]|nr:hypothetical protein [Candidatus Sulfopaludibacter sp.]
MMIPFQATLSQGALRFLKILALAGAAAVAGGLIWEPGRAWAAVLMAGYLLTGFGLAGIVFVAVQYASGAGWSTAFRRVPEAMSAILPIGAALLAAVFLLHPSTYPWTSHAPHRGFQEIWLSRPFFLVRAAVYIAAWIAFAAAIVRTSRRQDVDSGIGHTRRNVRLSIVFLVVFAVTFWLASFDWVMSL